MTEGIGALGHVGVRKEEAFASGGAVDNYQPIDSESLGLVQEHVYGDRIQATEEQVGGIRNRRMGAGAVVFGVSPDGPLQWWQCGLGQSSSPYSSERPLNSMLLEVDREAGAVQTSGAMISSLSFASTQGSGPDTELKCTATIESKDFGGISASNPSFETDDAPFIHSEAVFTINDSPEDNVTGFTLNIANNPVTDLYGSDKTRQEIPATKIVVTGSFTKMFENTTERNAFFAGDNVSFQVTFTRGAQSFDINVAKAKYDTRPAPLTGQSVYVAETFNWTAFVDDSSSENSVVITVTQ